MSATRNRSKFMDELFCFEFLFSLSLLCIHLSSSIKLLPFSNPILWFKPKETVIASPLPPHTHTAPPLPSSLLLLSQQGTLSPPLKIKLTIFSANTLLLVSSNFNDFGSQSDSPLLLIQFHSPAYKPTRLLQSVSWLLRSSPTDIKPHTAGHPAIVNSSSQRIQTSSHLAPKTADTSVYLLSFLSKTPRYASLLNSFTEQPVGSQPHCPSMTCNCANTTGKISGWVLANKPDYHFISITLFRKLSLLRWVMANLKKLVAFLICNTV